MTDKNTAAFVGGDTRSLCAARELKNLGYEVRLFGFDECGAGGICESIADACRGAKAVVLPIPYSPDGVYLKAPFSRYKIAAADLTGCLESGQIAVGGCFDGGFAALLGTVGVTAVDCCARRDFKVLNAIPTAEGAIAAAINETDFTLHGSRCAVLTYGCVGEAVAKLLYAAGAKVTVAARASADRARAAAAGMRAIAFDALGGAVEKSDIVFNAAPARVLEGSVLARARRGTLVIDLASGTDEESAKKAGVKLIKAPSLPDRTAPATAGLYLAQTVDNIIKGVV